MINNNEIWRIGNDGWMGYTENKKVWKEIINKKIKSTADYTDSKGKVFAIQFLLKNENEKQLFESLHAPQQGSLEL